MTDTKAETQSILTPNPEVKKKSWWVFVLTALATVAGVCLLVFACLFVFALFNGAFFTKTTATQEIPANVSPDLAKLIEQHPVILSDRCLSRLFGVNKQFTERYDGDIDVLECPNLIPGILQKNGIPGKLVGASMAMEFCFGLQKLDGQTGDDCRTMVLQTDMDSDTAGSSNKG